MHVCSQSRHTLWVPLQPARLLCPWDVPGKNTGMGYHFLPVHDVTKVGRDLATKKQLNNTQAIRIIRILRNMCSDQQNQIFWLGNSVTATPYPVHLCSDQGCQPYTPSQSHPNWSQSTISDLIILVSSSGAEKVVYLSSLFDLS